MRWASSSRIHFGRNTQKAVAYTAGKFILGLWNNNIAGLGIGVSVNYIVVTLVL